MISTCCISFSSCFIYFLFPVLFLLMCNQFNHEKLSDYKLCICCFIFDIYIKISLGTNCWITQLKLQLPSILRKPPEQLLLLIFDININDFWFYCATLHCRFSSKWNILDFFIYLFNILDKSLHCLHPQALQRYFSGFTSCFRYDHVSGQAVPCSANGEGQTHSQTSCSPNACSHSQHDRIAGVCLVGGGGMSRDKELRSSCLFVSRWQQPDSITLQTNTPSPETISWNVFLPV